MTAMFIKLSMYLDQRSGGKDVAKSTFSVPFRNWLPGYVVVTRSSGDEEWTIAAIHSPDNKMRRENCEVQLINKAGETRLVKGSTLQSGYEFRSSGDLPVPPTDERSDIKPISISVQGIREFYPRNQGEGTRILMHDKTTYIVAESFYAIWDMLTEVLGVSPGKAGNSGAMTGCNDSDPTDSYFPR
jgi:hypothetical protein